MNTNEYLAECEAKANEAAAIAEKATCGPIDVHRYDNDGGDIRWQLQQSDRAAVKDAEGIAVVLTDFSDLDNPNARNDATFYAHARTSNPDLAARVLALVKMVRERDERIEAMLDDAREAAEYRDYASDIFRGE